MCEDSDMDEFTAAYLRLDARLTLLPAPVASAGPETLAAYPAREVAAALMRARGVRGFPHKPTPSRPTAALALWDDLRWRWREDDREIVIGFSVRPDAPRGPDDAEAPIWAGSPLSAQCLYEDVARLTLTLQRRFPLLRLRRDTGQDYTPAQFVEAVALARLAPALASDDAATRDRAAEAQALYADLLASAPRHAPAEEALAAAPFTILAADEHLLAVNKPAGVVTHPTYKHPDGTLTDAVFAREEAQGRARPWLLHRLDKETSGVILFARSDQARRSVVSQFERHSARKRYLALTCWPPLHAPGGEDGEIDLPLARDALDRRRVVVALDGQPSRTRYRLLATARGYALIQAEPVTGRTHQIRAHLAAIGAPLVGDAAYLPAHSHARDLAPRVMLHAWRLDVRAPGSEELWSVTAPPPADFIATAEALGLGEGLRAALATVETPQPS